MYFLVKSIFFKLKISFKNEKLLKLINLFNKLIKNEKKCKYFDDFSKKKMLFFKIYQLIHKLRFTFIGTKLNKIKDFLSNHNLYFLFKNKNLFIIKP